MAKLTSVLDRVFHVTHPPAQIPTLAWTLCLAIAFGGSLLFGGSVALTVDGVGLWQHALKLTIASGASWPVLGVALFTATRCPLVKLIHACLLTIVTGECVLVAGAAGNLGLALAYGDPIPFAIPFNISVVIAANLTMATALALLLHRNRIPIVTTLLCWTIALNGTGLALYLMIP